MDVTYGGLGLLVGIGWQGLEKNVRGLESTEGEVKNKLIVVSMIFLRCSSSIVVTDSSVSNS